MSKKQLQHLHRATSLLACSLLLCFPGGIPFTFPFPVLNALVSGLLALGIAHSLLKLGKLPSSMRIGVLFPIAFSAVLTLRVLPHLLTVLWLMLPFAFILLFIRPRFKSIGTLWFFIVVWGCLSLGAAGLLDILNGPINQGLPRLPSHWMLWLCIGAVIPLGFASRPVLRPLARAIARTQIWACLLLLGLYPLLWCAATSFKIPGEPERSFHQFAPEPRFFLLPKEGIPDLTPSELRDNSLKKEILFTLNEMIWRLSDIFIASTFQDEGPLAPEEKLRAMKLYGFLLEDRYGPFLPGESFSREAPDEMDPRFLPDFRASMEQIAMRPSELSRLLKLDSDKTDRVFRELEAFNWIRKIPGEDLKYRLTPQARKPFENGLYPRQLLMLQNRVEKEMVQSEYVPRRKLSTYQILDEFRALEQLGAAETRPVWHWNQHSEFLLNAARWKKTGILTLLAVLALLAGRCFSDHLPRNGVRLLSLSGILIMIQVPGVAEYLPAVRIFLGLWVARNLVDLNDGECDRISFFAACGYISASIMPLASDSNLIHQCAWILIWTIPALLLLGLAIRPLKQES